MRVIAFDPGKMTGWATYHVETRAYEAGQLEFMPACIRLEEEIATAHAASEALVVITESFLITVNTAKNTQAPWSLELIGVFRYLTKRYVGSDIVLQSPSSAKSFGTDDKLREMGFYRPGMRHANDAARHLLLYVASKKILSEEQLLKLVR